MTVVLACCELAAVVDPFVALAVPPVDVEFEFVEALAFAPDVELPVFTE